MTQELHASATFGPSFGQRHFDLIAIVAASSISELDLVIDRIGEIDGVEKTLSSIILSTRINR